MLSLETTIASIRSSTPPAGVATRLIAIDGHGGAGKTTLATFIAKSLEAPIIHTDDFASWENETEWWPVLLEKVLAPLAAGYPVGYTPSSWGGLPKPPVLIGPGDFVILEGVSASRQAFRPYVAFSIWVATPRELRLRRGLERDGEDARVHWERWIAQEDAYVAREHPEERADVVLPGDADLWI